MALYGLNRKNFRNLLIDRLVAGIENDATPVYAPLFLKASAEPSGTAVKGALYFDSTANCLMQYTGSAWQRVGASLEDLTISDDLVVTDDLAVTGLVTVGETLGVTGRTTLTGNTMATTAGTGITTGVGTVYASGALRIGTIVRTVIMIDIEGLNSAATNDIIGVDAAASCHLGQYTTAVSGTVFAGNMTCLEVPVTGDTDIDLWSADESTGTEDAAISGLTGELQVVTAGGAWTLNESIAFTVMPGANDYFYLTSGGAGASATYTAGKFLIEMYGLAS